MSSRFNDSIDEKLKALWGKLGIWDFQIFQFSKNTDGRPLYCMGMELFDVYNFQEGLNVPIANMAKFLTRIETAYSSKNSYHNSIHAADVMHSMHYFISMLGMGQLLSKEVDGWLTVGNFRVFGGFCDP